MAIIISGGRAVDTDGLTEAELNHFNDLDSKLGAPKREETPLDDLLRKSTALARQADELRAAVVALMKQS